MTAAGGEAGDGARGPAAGPGPGRLWAGCQVAMAGRGLWAAVGVALLAACAGRAGGVLSLDSAFVCKRLDGQALNEGELALYNPSAVWREETGWTVLFRHDQCHPGYSPVCPVYTTVPFASNLGREAQPDHSLLGRHAREVTYTAATQARLDELNSSVVHLGDLRCPPSARALAWHCCMPAASSSTFCVHNSRPGCVGRSSGRARSLCPTSSMLRTSHPLLSCKPCPGWTRPRPR